METKGKLATSFIDPEPLNSKNVHVLGTGVGSVDCFVGGVVARHGERGGLFGGSLDGADRLVGYSAKAQDNISPRRASCSLV